MSAPKVTVGIASKNRYETLAATLLSVALQTFVGMEIIIADDSDNAIDHREHPAFQHVFSLLNFKQIPFRVIYGPRKGQHHLHQIIQEKAAADWVWRVDDDEIAEPDVLENLWQWTHHGQVGAVGGLVPQGPLLPAPADAANLIGELGRSNLQWFSHGDRQMPYEVEHLHSSFLYRKGVARYELGLSPAAHREETIFSHEIFRAGYKLLVEPSAITWHIRGATGGIRSHPSPDFWANDERIFQNRLREWGISGAHTKYVVLDAGMGDHVVFKSLLPRIKAKYPHLVVAASFPEVFWDDNLQLESIADAHRRFGDLSRFNVYVWCIDHKWTGTLQDAFAGMLEL